MRTAPVPVSRPHWLHGTGGILRVWPGARAAPHRLHGTGGILRAQPVARAAPHRLHGTGGTPPRPTRHHFRARPGCAPVQIPA